MKRYLLILLLLVALGSMLSACKVQDGEVTAVPKNYPQWEYMTVVKSCAVDRQSSKVVCQSIKGNDSTILKGMLESYGNEGWELVSVVTTTVKSGDQHTFVFKRPK